MYFFRLPGDGGKRKASMQEHKDTISSNKQRSITQNTGFFCPSPSPDGQKGKYPLCPLCGEKILLLIRNRNYE
jgi:hypothetical protein